MKRATIHQLNKVAKNKRLPHTLEKLLSLSSNVFIGKGVEKEVNDFFRDFGISRDRRDNFLFIDVIILIRTCDVIQRHHPEDAQQYAANGSFSVSEDVADDASPRIFFDAGIQWLSSSSLNVRLDWYKALSKSMLQYAADDVACVYDVLSAAADLLGASRSDFIQAIHIHQALYFHSRPVFPIHFSSPYYVSYSRSYPDKKSGRRQISHAWNYEIKKLESQPNGDHHRD